LAQLEGVRERRLITDPVAYLKGNNKDNENEICKSSQLFLTGGELGNTALQTGNPRVIGTLLPLTSRRSTTGFVKHLKALLGWLWLEQMK
jgi:hypothetical protein